MGIKLEERETRFERATSTLARLRSTPELYSLFIKTKGVKEVKN